MKIAWRARNSFCVTGDKRVLLTRPEVIRVQVEKSKGTLLRGEETLMREEKFIRWERSQEDWYKVNVDGATIQRLGIAGVGGVLRDS